MNAKHWLTLAAETSDAMLGATSLRDYVNARFVPALRKAAAEEPSTLVDLVSEYIRALAIIERRIAHGPRDSLSVADAATCLMKEPAVREFAVIEERKLVNRPISKVPGGGGAWNENTVPETKYRAWIATEKAHGRAADGTDLAHVITRAFALANLPSPAWIPQPSTPNP